MKLVKEIHLKNGLTVSIFNHNHRYFGDYYRVRVEFTCAVPIREDYFSSQAAFAEARESMGSAALFKRSVEQMGVSTDELESCLERIIGNFSSHSLSYLESPEFPRKLIQKELANAKLAAGGTYQG
jgi:hypothetical protein